MLQTNILSPAWTLPWTPHHSAYLISILEWIMYTSNLMSKTGLLIFFHPENVPLDLSYLNKWKFYVSSLLESKILDLYFSCKLSRSPHSFTLKICPEIRQRHSRETWCSVRLTHKRIFWVHVQRLPWLSQTHNVIQDWMKLGVYHSIKTLLGILSLSVCLSYSWKRYVNFLKEKKT